MIEAKIIADPGPAEAQPADTLARCVSRLSANDRDYYRRRADQETEAAGKASCCEARLAHEELAAAYRQLCRSNDVEPEPHLASELTMFRFNPRPAD